MQLLSRQELPLRNLRFSKVAQLRAGQKVALLDQCELRTSRESCAQLRLSLPATQPQQPIQPLFLCFPKLSKSDGRGPAAKYIDAHYLRFIPGRWPDVAVFFSGWLCSPKEPSESKICPLAANRPGDDSRGLERVVMRVYRPAGPLVWTFAFLAVVSAFYFAWAAIMLTARAIQTPDEWLPALLLLAFLAALTSVFPGLLIVLVSEKIVVHGLWITLIGPIRKRTIHLRDVTRVRWRKDDSVTLIAGRVRQSHWFGAYRVEDAADLIKLIRNNVPAALHEGWHPFYQARMKGRIDSRQRILLRNPRAKFAPEPLKVGRLVAISFGTSLIVALGFWGAIVHELRHTENLPPAPLTGSWLLDCLTLAAFANLPPLLLVFIEHFRTRRQRQVWEATGIEFV